MLRPCSRLNSLGLQSFIFHTPSHLLKFDRKTELQKYRFLNTSMHSGDIWKWLDTVDQHQIDPLDQWGVPQPRHPLQDTMLESDNVTHDGDGETYQQHNRERNAEVASLLKSTPSSGIRLRNGSIRMNGKNHKFFAHDVKSENHPISLVPGFPPSVADDHQKYIASQSTIHGIATNFEGTAQQASRFPTRRLQTSGRERHSDATNPTMLPTAPDAAPAINVEDKDPVAINCQGARVVRGGQQNGLQGLPSMRENSRRNTTAGDGTLHRSNALKIPWNVRGLGPSDDYW